MAIKKNGKTPDNSMEITPLSKSCATWIDFMHPEASLLFCSTKDNVKRLIYTLCKWAESEDAIEITQFCMEYKMPRSTLYAWRDRYPELKEVLDNLNIFLGCRRRVGALKKVYDKDVVFKDMHRYDSEWLEINKYHADLKREEDNSEKKYILIDRILEKYEDRDKDTTK